MFNLRKFVLFFICLIGVFSLSSFKASATPVLNRFAGTDRYSTAVEISKDGWQSSNYVIIVSGENFPDALCSAPLAKKYDAPILLTQAGGMSTEVIQEIQRLGAQNAIIIGGTGAVSEAVENQLKSINVAYTRIQGTDRYETSLKIAQMIGTENGVVIASGENFPDSLSIAPVAAAQQMPILLTMHNSMPDDIKSFIQNNTSSKYYVIGGTSVVNDSVVNGLTNIKRLGGSDRYQTNMLILGEFGNSMNFNNVYVATGEDFADAIGGAAAAAKTSSPIALTSSSNFSAQSIVQSYIGSVTSVKILGGTAVVSDNSVDEIINGGPVKICIDPGHGGYDTGAIGPTGIYEKNVNLAIALKLGQILQEAGIDVVYTRTSDNVRWPSDVVKDLQTRCDIANNAEVNYFVCIHANSSDSPSANGTETYYLDGSTEGQKLAQDIQQELVQANGLQDRGVKTAGYYVLKNTNAPAILTEVAFISNPKEESLLNDNDFEEKCAQGIANGILKCLSDKISK